MELIRRAVIVMGFFLFFTYCGDGQDIEPQEKGSKYSHIKTNNVERYARKITGQGKPCMARRTVSKVGNKRSPKYIQTKIPKARRELITKNLKARGVFGASVNTNNLTDLTGIDEDSGPNVSNRLQASFNKLPDDMPNTEKYIKLKSNKLKRASITPLSTFSIDVDTASYSLVKSMIKDGGFNKNAVRTEEFINYFTYDYPQPKDDKPFSVTTEIAPSILNKNRHIIHIGIQGRKKADNKRKNANIVFLVDTSGSMTDSNKLPLLKKSLNILTNNLNKDDVITIVTYAGNSYVALEPTSGTNKNKIKEAVNKLEAYGGTNGEGGILVAYKKAKEKFDKNKINRIILCTDGDFNIGVNSVEDLHKLVKEKRKSGITLTSIGFGRGNYNDTIMEKLADNGNGNYFYINDINEARKVFSKELTANLEVIAKDVKIQVEFNPKLVSYYKLIGYENRMLKKEDFNNDKIDAGEIGSGHTVTALYEIVLTSEKNQPVDKLRYNNVRVGSDAYPSDTTSPELAFVKLRYKSPNGNKSKLITFPILEKNIIKEIKNTSNNFKFSSAVAAFALKLKSQIDISNKTIIELAKSSKGSDEFGYRKEFISLVKKISKK